MRKQAWLWKGVPFLPSSCGLKNCEWNTSTARVKIPGNHFFYDHVQVRTQSTNKTDKNIFLLFPIHVGDEFLVISWGKRGELGRPCSHRTKRGEGTFVPVNIRDAVAVPCLGWTLILQQCTGALCRRLSAGQQELSSALGTNFPSKGKVAGCSKMAEKLDAIWVFPSNIAAPEYGLNQKRLLPVHSI